MKYLIINGHPDINSFSSKLAKSIYEKIRSEYKESELLNICELKFSPIYIGYSALNKAPLEEDILKAQKLLEQAEHIILVTPVWWSTYPALLKGFFDRVLLPGFAFKFNKGSSRQEKLLKNKTSELILLSDAPAWYRKYLLNDPASRALKRDILGFCGIKVKKVHRYGEIGKLNSQMRQKIIQNHKSKL